MNWTQNKPTEQGIYLTRLKWYSEPEVIVVSKVHKSDELCATFCNSSVIHPVLKLWPMLYFGPIPEAPENLQKE